MNYQGVLTKMQTEIGSPIQYYLVFKDDFLNVNQLLNKKISLHFEGYECLNCHKAKKIYRQGFCYDCFFGFGLLSSCRRDATVIKSHITRRKNHNIGDR